MNPTKITLTNGEDVQIAFHGGETKEQATFVRLDKSLVMGIEVDGYIRIYQEWNTDGIYISIGDMRLCVQQTSGHTTWNICAYGDNDEEEFSNAVRDFAQHMRPRVPTIGDRYNCNPALISAAPKIPEGLKV